MTSHLVVAGGVTLTLEIENIMLVDAITVIDLNVG
jgi:hypothetical protein